MKQRFFCLTWNYLTYYDPTTKMVLDHIVLSTCTDVLVGTDQKVHSFKLLSPGRTYLFVSQDAKERQIWIKNLRAIITMHRPQVLAFGKYEEIKQVALHLLRVFQGLTILRNTHRPLGDQIGLVSESFFSLLEAFGDTQNSERKEKIVAFSEKFQREFEKMKTMIPLAHRFQPEDPNFDIAAEQRQINILLAALSLEPTEKPQNQDDIQNDLKPYIVNMVQHCFSIGSLK